MKSSTEILREIKAETYGFNMVDVAVAAIIKSYLMNMAKEAAVEQLGRIVSPGVKEMQGGSVKENKIPQEKWATINGAELASLIDSAAAGARVSAEEWKAGEGEKTLSKAIDYIQNNVLPNLSGKKYVTVMPVEMAEFVTDCWLAVA